MNPATDVSPPLEPSGDPRDTLDRSAREQIEFAPAEPSHRAHTGEELSASNDTHEILTIGHAALPWSQFLELLRRFEIALVVDIRRFPGSRHAPQFGQDVMRAALTIEGIEYLHLSELGGRRRARPDSLNTTWRNASFRGYADYMETEEFRDGLDRLMSLAQTQRVAIMCAESVWWRCHRSMVSDALLAQGWRVLHIMSAGKLQPHHFTEPARLVNGTLTYREASMASEIPV